MSAAEISCLFRIERGMNPAENYVSAAFSRHFADFVTAQSVGRMDANSYYIPRLDSGRVDLKQCLVDKDRVAKTLRCRTGKHVLPARSDNRGSERDGARINEMHVHSGSSPAFLWGVFLPGNCGMREFWGTCCWLGEIHACAPWVYDRN